MLGGAWNGIGVILYSRGSGGGAFLAGGGLRTSFIISAIGGHGGGGGASGVLKYRVLKILWCSSSVMSLGMRAPGCRLGSVGRDHIDGPMGKPSGVHGK